MATFNNPSSPPFVRTAQNSPQLFARSRRNVRTKIQSCVQTYLLEEMKETMTNNFLKLYDTPEKISAALNSGAIEDEIMYKVLGMSLNVNGAGSSSGSNADLGGGSFNFGSSFGAAFNSNSHSNSSNTNSTSNTLTGFNNQSTFVGETKNDDTNATNFYTNKLPCLERLLSRYDTSKQKMLDGIDRNKYNHGIIANTLCCSKNHLMVVVENNGNSGNTNKCCLCNGWLWDGTKRFSCKTCGPGDSDTCLKCHPEDLVPCLCERSESWKLDQCADCKKDLGKQRLAEEERKAKVAIEEDRIQAERQPHAERIHSLGITIEALIAFAYKHDCWNWPTWKVVRDIIVPATSDTRCRYGDLPELKGCFGPATIFMSHCWAAKFGDLIGAACHGARKDRIVWIDIFAVRQWPGNVADLDFRGVIGRCDALVVSTSPVDGLKEWMGGSRDRDAFLASDNILEGEYSKRRSSSCNYR
jgi:hypothetical protein